MMTTSIRSAQIVIISSLVVLSLVLASLACNTTNMRARDLPVWTCPTDIPLPTHTAQPTATILPGQPTSTPRATYTPYPSPTPFILLSDFPLAKHVKIGGVGGVGFGIWVWVDHVEVYGPIEYINPDNGQHDRRFVAQWDVTAENASLTRSYEVYPFAQFYVLEVIEADGQTRTKGAWGVSSQAHQAIGLEPLGINQDTNVLAPGDRRTFTVAGFIPAPEVWRIGYVLDPLDTVDIEEMLDRNTLGSNVGVWINTYDDTCTGEVTLGPPGADTPTLPAGGNRLLTGHPVSTPTITRGFGCTAFYTGEMDSNCPASQPWFHNGIDYAVTTGTETFQVVDGQVTIQHAADNPSGEDCSTMQGSQPPHNGYGNYIKAVGVVQNEQLQVWWAHLSDFNVAAPQVSNKGDVVGFAGSTGCSNGPHIHFAVKVNGQYVDPLTIMP